MLKNDCSKIRIAAEGDARPADQAPELDVATLHRNLPLAPTPRGSTVTMKCTSQHEVSAEHEPQFSSATSSQLQSTHHADDLLLREIHHRSSNDLQLVVSLLALQSRRSASSEAREALSDAMKRVSILARARWALQQPGQNSLEGALRQVCEALQSQAEPRGILLSLEVDDCSRGFPSAKIVSVALTVNELATNAIKHAFAESKTGHVRVSLRQHGAHYVFVIVDDDGLPFPEITKLKGLGLDIAKRLIAGIGGVLIVPRDGSKAFQLRIPLRTV